MRTNGGTIYTFSSAVEDIGLNINERNNVVKISNFALLDIPAIQDNNFESDLARNKFNIRTIAGALEYSDEASVKDGRVLIAESFQNYALNLESNLLNQTNYNPALSKTVSERVFWKWLKESGSIRWQKDVSANFTQYWSEEIDADGDDGYNSVVKYIGKVSAGNVRTDSFGTYNETYILVPTSHGQTDAFFKIVEDDNYKHNMKIGDLGENILGREGYTNPHPDALSYSAYYDFVDSSTNVTNWQLEYDNTGTGTFTPGWWYTADDRNFAGGFDNAYLTDSNSYLTSESLNTDIKAINGADEIYTRRSKVDCLSLVFEDNELKTIYDDPTLTYDKMAIENAVNDSYNFNTALNYYTVYNSTMDEILGTNLLGVLFLDAPSGTSAQIPTEGIVIPSLEKIQSGATGFGTSYSLRLNIKTDNMMDDTQAVIVDEATSNQLDVENWTEAFANLGTAVNILTQNNSTIQFLSNQYTQVSETQTQLINDVQALNWRVNEIKPLLTGTKGTVPLFGDPDDLFIDSSIYMLDGKIGLFTKEPVADIELGKDTLVNGSLTTSTLILEDILAKSTETKPLYYNESTKQVSYGNIDASGMTGVIPISSGGTGLSSVTVNSLLTGNGSSPLTAETDLSFDGAISLLSVTGKVLASEGLYTNTSTSLKLGFDAAKLHTDNANRWTAIGNKAGDWGQTNWDWTAVGYAAGGQASGSRWTAIGATAGQNNSSGDDWIAIGPYCGGTGTGFTAIGRTAASSSSGDNFISIGNYSGIYNDSNEWIAIGVESAGHIANGATNLTAATNSLYLGSFSRASANGVINENVIGHTAIGMGPNTFTFGDDSILDNYFTGNISTTGTIDASISITGPNVTSGADPGHTHTPLVGTSAERLLATTTPMGTSFWDTDLKIPCYLEGTTWYNAAGGIIL